jgi:hypothetical protein
VVSIATDVVSNTLKCPSASTPDHSKTQRPSLSTIVSVSPVWRANLPELRPDPIRTNLHRSTGLIRQEQIERMLNSSLVELVTAGIEPRQNDGADRSVGTKSGETGPFPGKDCSEYQNDNAFMKS